MKYLYAFALVVLFGSLMMEVSGSDAPSPCPAIYRPVCGCNGKTYSSDCEMNHAGVELKYSGPCGDPWDDDSVLRSNC